VPRRGLQVAMVYRHGLQVYGLQACGLQVMVSLDRSYPAGPMLENTRAPARAHTHTLARLLARVIFRDITLA
jgi:hypothetical protein